MHPTDIVGWTNGTGCIFCTACEPSDGPEKAPVFADDDDWRAYTCDACEEPLAVCGKAVR